MILSVEIFYYFSPGFIVLLRDVEGLEVNLVLYLKGAV